MATWRTPNSPEQVQADIRDLLLVLAASFTAGDTLERDEARQSFVRFLKARRDA